MSCTIEEIDNQYYWYCCQCGEGPYNWAIQASCFARSCNNHVRCNKSVVKPPENFPYTPPDTPVATTQSLHSTLDIGHRHRDLRNCVRSTANTDTEDNEDKSRSLAKPVSDPRISRIVGRDKAPKFSRRAEGVQGVYQPHSRQGNVEHRKESPEAASEDSELDEPDPPIASKDIFHETNERDLGLVIKNGIREVVDSILQQDTESAATTPSGSSDNIRVHGYGHGSCHTTSSTSCISQSSSKKHARKGDQQNAPDGSDGDDMNRDEQNKRRRTSCDLSETPPRTSPVFMCPFFKHNPFRYRDCQKYRLTNVSRVKGHVEREHRLYECMRCFKILYDKNDFTEHQRDPTCVHRGLNDRHPQPIEGFYEEMRSQWTSKTGPTAPTPVQQWEHVYETIFGIDKPTPTCYYEKRDMEQGNDPNLRDDTEAQLLYEINLNIISRKVLEKRVLQFVLSSIALTLARLGQNQKDYIVQMKSSRSPPTAGKRNQRRPSIATAPGKPITCDEPTAQSPDSLSNRQGQNSAANVLPLDSSQYHCVDETSYFEAANDPLINNDVYFSPFHFSSAFTDQSQNQRDLGDQQLWPTQETFNIPKNPYPSHESMSGSVLANDSGREGDKSESQRGEETIRAPRSATNVEQFDIASYNSQMYEGEDDMMDTVIDDPFSMFNPGGLDLSQLLEGESENVEWD